MRSTRSESIHHEPRWPLLERALPLDHADIYPGHHASTELSKAPKPYQIWLLTWPILAAFKMVDGGLVKHPPTLLPALSYIVGVPTRQHADSSLPRLPGPAQLRPALGSSISRSPVDNLIAYDGPQDVIKVGRWSPLPGLRAFEKQSSPSVPGSQLSLPSAACGPVLLSILLSVFLSADCLLHQLLLVLQHTCGRDSSRLQATVSQYGDATIQGREGGKKTRRRVSTS